MRSVFFGVFQSLVVLLYILDNETNFVVQVSVFIGVLIDLWKITKVMDVRVRAAPDLAGDGMGRGPSSRPARPGASPGAFPVPASLPGPRGLSEQGIFQVTRGAGELGAVGRAGAGAGVGAGVREAA